MTFKAWWRINHPLDWWRGERKGNPLPSFDRILVWALCRKAYEAGRDGK